MCMKKGKNKELTTADKMMIAVIILIGLFVIFILYTAPKGELFTDVDLTENDIRSFNVYWLENDNWDRWCELNPDTLSAGNWAWDILIGLPKLKDIDKVEYSWIYDGKRSPSSSGCWVMQDIGNSGFYSRKLDYGTGEFSIDARKDNKMTFCVGVNNCNDLCQEVILPAKCQ